MSATCIRVSILPSFTTLVLVSPKVLQLNQIIPLYNEEDNWCYASGYTNHYLRKSEEKSEPTNIYVRPGLNIGLAIQSLNHATSDIPMPIYKSPRVSASYSVMIQFCPHFIFLSFLTFFSHMTLCHLISHLTLVTWPDDHLTFQPHDHSYHSHLLLSYSPLSAIYGDLIVSGSIVLLPIVLSCCCLVSIVPRALLFVSLGHLVMVAALVVYKPSLYHKRGLKPDLVS